MNVLSVGELGQVSNSAWIEDYGNTYYIIDHKSKILLGKIRILPCEEEIKFEDTYRKKQK